MSFRNLKNKCKKNKCSPKIKYGQEYVVESLFFLLKTSLQDRKKYSTIKHIEVNNQFILSDNHLSVEPISFVVFIIKLVVYRKQNNAIN